MYETMLLQAEGTFELVTRKQKDRLILLICRFVIMFNTNSIRLRVTNVKNI